MDTEKDQLEDLKSLLKHKKSKEFYSKRLGITIDEVEDLLKELRTEKSQNSNYDIKIDDLSKNNCDVSSSFNLDKGTATFTSVTDGARTLEQLLIDHKVDGTKYRVSNYWSKQKGDKYYHSLLLTLIKAESKEQFQEDFIEFIKTFEGPTQFPKKNHQDGRKKKISLILPKQDAHFNKYDIYGDNDIEQRFIDTMYDTEQMVLKAQALNYLEEIVYIVGSDQFNSEWTCTTTKFTPQKNILSYQESFQKICSFEVDIIEMLRESCNNLRIVFIPGNHDEFVGWHLINWLQVYFKDSDIAFDTSIINTKYHKYGNTAIMLNHGDAIKPKELAHKFPIGFRERWSECEHFCIFTGDKHTELSLDIHGIKFYQIPQLSHAKSSWDDKQGYIDSKAEMTAFVITEDNGISDIYKTIVN